MLAKTKSVAGNKSDHQNLAGSILKSRIEKKVWIKASAEVVYKALTDPKELARWFCDRASCDARKGGELVACWSSGKSNQKGRAVFTRIVPNSELELLWVDDGGGLGSDPPKHTLSYKIGIKAGMTEVVMVDVDDSILDEETRSFLDEGWNTVLLELRDYCERKERSARIRPRPKSRVQEVPSE